MGTCYSGLGSKSCPSAQSPIDPKNRQIICDKSIEIKNKIKTNKEFDCKQLSSSFEDISYSEVIDKTRDKTSMSSQTNRHKIPIPTKLLPNNKVVPKESQEVVTNRYKTRRYETPIEVNKVMVCDNSSSTSISSGSSINLSKSSYKTSSSSTLNSVRPQTSIPKPKSRTPTPPLPVKYASNMKNRNQKQQFNEKNNKLTQNNSSVINDRLNGNKTLTNPEVSKNDNKIDKNKYISNESKTSKSNPKFGFNYGTSIKYTTQMGGLPRPQTAHIVSTASHNTDNTFNHKINHLNDIETHLTQYSQNKSPTVKCDPNLRQLKPYYYGMNKPYERPNNFNYNRLQIQSQNANQTKQIYSQNIIEKSNSITSNESFSSKLSFPSTLQTMKTSLNNSLKSENSSVNEKKFENKNFNYINKNSQKSEISEDIINKNCKENSVLPKSFQRVREFAPIFARKDLKVYKERTETTAPVFADNDKPVPIQTSPEHNSISSDADNRDFLIDDEISDQPELVFSSNIEKKDLVKSLHSELEGLILKQEPSVSPPLPSSPSISRSNSSTSTIIPNSTTFRKPRPLSLVEMPDGSYGLDSPSFRAACQDLIGIKTLLFRLHGILQNAETLNPFDHNYSQNKFYQHLIVSESDEIKPKDNDLEALQTENIDLKRQIVLQQQMIEDKDRTIRLLQQQMAKYSNINNTFVTQNLNPEKVNACSQTDRCANASHINPRAVSDGSNGMLVSVCCSHIFETDN